MTSPSIAADQAARLLSSFSSFLTVAVHSLLFHRALYPARSFLTTRAYNLPVHQSRHPGVCAWVADAVAAIAAQIRSGAARAVVLAVHAPQSMTVLERWVFDLQSFPASWGDAAAAGGGHRDSDGPATGMDDLGAAGLEAAAAAAATGGEGQDEINWTDVNEGLRGALRRIAYAGEKSPPLPDNCTFTLAVELREESEAPIGHPQAWIPAEAKHDAAAGRQDMNTAPIRSVRAGPLFFECWLEKKMQAQESQDHQ
ncbi:DNA-binding HORMA [Beauveria brongniartii RCEF 3172]|uniref:DNA-binding HORMA n=1 Tax=Beauveria brongniartii RCEF 3172 TaxID=1081107 RepID=A0A167L5R5_9HYPO|nr:DNA-binding HORMA [Beauveria brongniartii RCEF 3172]